MLVNAGSLATDSVRARDGLVGRVDDLLFDDEEWIGRFMVVKTGPGIFGRHLLVSPLHVKEVDPEKSEIRIRLTRAEARSGPDLATVDVVSRAKEREYESYRRTPTYWSGSGLWGREEYPDAMPSVNVPQTLESRSIRDEVRVIHNRSTRAIRGYRAEVDGEEIGVVTDLLIDPVDFAVYRLVIEPGRVDKSASAGPRSNRVEVPVTRVDRISWVDSTVHLSPARKPTLSALPGEE